MKSRFQLGMETIFQDPLHIQVGQYYSIYINSSMLSLKTNMLQILNWRAAV